MRLERACITTTTLLVSGSVIAATQPSLFTDAVYSTGLYAISTLFVLLSVSSYSLPAEYRTTDSILSKYTQNSPGLHAPGSTSKSTRSRHSRETMPSHPYKLDRQVLRHYGYCNLLYPGWRWRSTDLRRSRPSEFGS